jgi:hypothetical protein
LKALERAATEGESPVDEIAPISLISVPEHWFAVRNLGGGVNHDKTARKRLRMTTKRLTSRYGHKKCRPETSRDSLGSEMGLAKKQKQSFPKFQLANAV